MKWTRAKPTVPELYWFRGVNKTENPKLLGYEIQACIVEVVQESKGLGVLFMGSDFPLSMASLDGEWAGPLSPPEDQIACPWERPLSDHCDKHGGTLGDCPAPAGSRRLSAMGDDG